MSKSLTLCTAQLWNSASDLGNSGINAYFRYSNFEQLSYRIVQIPTLRDIKKLVAYTEEEDMYITLTTEEEAMYITLTAK